MSVGEIKAVLFDVDGTLIDSVDAHAKAWQETFHHFGIDLDYSEIRNQIGKGSEKLIQTLAGQEFWEKHGEEASERLARRGAGDCREPITEARVAVLGRNRLRR